MKKKANGYDRIYRVRPDLRCAILFNRAINTELETSSIDRTSSAASGPACEQDETDARLVVRSLIISRRERSQPVTPVTPIKCIPSRDAPSAAIETVLTLIYVIIKFAIHLYGIFFSGLINFIDLLF